MDLSQNMSIWIELDKFIKHALLPKETTHMHFCQVICVLWLKQKCTCALLPGDFYATTTAVTNQ